MPDPQAADSIDPQTRIRELQARLEEAEEILQAIRNGQVDAIIVENQAGEQLLYTLESADRPYRTLIEQMEEGAFTITAEGVILYGNRRLADILGVSQEQLIGSPLGAFMQPKDSSSLDWMLQAARHGAARRELSIVNQRGHTVSIYLSLSLLGQDKDAPLLCGVVTDLSQQKHHLRELELANARLQAEIAERARIEEVLRHLQRVESIGHLSAGVAHDFNNILQGIIGSLEMVLDELPDDTEPRRFVGVALAAANRGSSLTQRLLSYARKQVLRPQIVDLASFIADLRILLGRTLGPHIIVEAEVDGSPCVLVDAGQLEAALLNLAINAAHAMPRGGTLRIKVGDAPGSRPLTLISVNDTGAGMDAATLAQAVEPFFTTKGVEGTGLGLTMVKGFAEQSGGTFHIDSTPNHGTVVHLCLPSCTATAKRTEPVGLEPKQDVRILVTDDSPDVLAVTGAALENAGFAVVRANGAEAALAMLAGGDRFGAIVADYGLRGISGLDLISRCRTIQPDLPALIITGFAGVQHLTAVGGRTKVLQKPFRRAALVDALQSMLETA